MDFSPLVSPYVFFFFEMFMKSLSKKSLIVYGFMETYMYFISVIVIFQFEKF